MSRRDHVGVAPLPTAGGQGRLVVLCGLPGSGKTTTAVRLAEELCGVRLCSDEWMTGLGLDLYDEPARARVDALQQDLALDLLRDGPPEVAG